MTINRHNRGRHATAIIAALCITACASLTVGREKYLPPPPKALSPIAQIVAPDSTEAIRAESLLVEQVKHPGTSNGTAVAKGRFSKSPIYEQPTADAEEELFTAREKARGVVTDWSEVGDAEYTMVLHQAWGLLRTVMRTGDEVTVRSSIWPQDVRVVPGSARVIRLESGWIDLDKISPTELKCQKQGKDRFHTPVVGGGKPGVRLVAGIEAAEARFRSAVTAGTELRGIAYCEASPVWRDRVAEFTFDAWMGADRAAKLGGPPLITR
jgi:hypothetical protein